MAIVEATSLLGRRYQRLAGVDYEVFQKKGEYHDVTSSDLVTRKINHDWKRPIVIESYVDDVWRPTWRV